MPWATLAHATAEALTAEVWPHAADSLDASMASPGHWTPLADAVTHFHGSRRSHSPTSFGALGALKGLAGGLLKKEPVPQSTTSEFEGEAPVPSKPQPHLSPAPGHPLFMQPPAVRAGLFANIAKKKMLEAKEHAEIAHKEADKAEDEWRKSVEFATEAAARRDACMKYQYHAGLVRTLNRLVGFSARTEAMLKNGEAPLGSQPPELIAAGTMVHTAKNQLDAANTDLQDLRVIADKLRVTPGYVNFAPKVDKSIRKLDDQRDRLQEIYDNLVKSEAIIRAQIPEEHSPPILPKRLLRPDGDPWWPERPPRPESGTNRLMLVKAYNPGAGFGPVQGSAGAQFL